MPNIPSEAPQGFSLQVGIPISHLREVEFHYILGQLSIAEESAIQRYLPDHTFDIHREVEAWQPRAKRSCDMCPPIIQSQQYTTKPTAAVQILGLSTYTWRQQHEVL
jgi:hypothetical protein